MTTLQTMRNRIANETGRYDLLEQLDSAILTAIQTYQNEPFVLNSAEYRINTGIGQEAYTLPTDLRTLANGVITSGEDILRIEGVINKTGSAANTIRGVTRQWLEQWYSTAGATGTPEFYHRQGNLIRFGPVPSAVLNIFLTGVKKLAPLTTGASTNAWMTDGEALIRNRAKAGIARDILMNSEMMQAAQAAEKEAFDDLKRNLSAYTMQPLASPNFQVRSDGSRTGATQRAPMAQAG